jgi:hypothetical protein
MASRIAFTEDCFVDVVSSGIDGGGGSDVAESVWARSTDGRSTAAATTARRCDLAYTSLRCNERSVTIEEEDMRGGSIYRNPAANSTIPFLTRNPYVVAFHSTFYHRTTAELMSRRSLFVSLLVTCSLNLLHAQSDSTRISYFPRDILFVPLLANHEEPRMGMQQEFGSTRLTLDIGSTLDLIQYAVEGDTIRIGADLFTYSLANSLKDIRLKIDAADGFLGVHFSYTNGSPWSFRFRAIHLSAHLVDGHYDPDAMIWKDGRNPIPFSRNYGEIVGAYSGTFGGLPTRLYAGASIAVFVRPTDIRRGAAVLGAETRTAGSVPLYIAYNFSLLGVPEFNGSNTVEAGIKFGAWSGRGVRLFLVYYNGLDTFGEYYKDRRELFGIGFAFDLW